MSIPLFSSDMSNSEIIGEILYSESSDQEVDKWDTAAEVLGEARMRVLATQRLALSDSSFGLFEKRIYPLLDNPNYIVNAKRNQNLLTVAQLSRSAEKIVFLLKKGAMFTNLSLRGLEDTHYDQILACADQFADLRPFLAQTPHFASYLLQTGKLLSGHIGPQDVTSYLLFLFKDGEKADAYLLSQNLAELATMVKNFGIVKEDPQYGPILKAAMALGETVFECVSPHLSVPDIDDDDNHHPIRYAFNRYMRTAIDGERGPRDPQAWLSYANKLAKPQNAILSLESVKNIVDQAKADFQSALENSQKAGKKLLFVIGEFHYSALSWLYEQVVLDKAHQAGFQQLLVEDDTSMIKERIERGGLRGGRLANWLATDWSLATAYEQGFSVLGIDTMHNHADLAEDGIKARDAAMATAIAGDQTVPAMQKNTFQAHAKVAQINSVAIVGMAHIPGLKERIGDRFYPFFVITDFRGEELAEKAGVRLLKTELNPRYLFPENVKEAYQHYLSML